MNTADVWGMIIGFLYSTKLHIILALVVIDIVLAVAAALKNKEFDFVKLGDFMVNLILPYVMVYMVLHIVVGMVTELEGILGVGLDTAVFLLIIASLVGAIFDNLKGLGLSILPNVRQANAVKDE